MDLKAELHAYLQVTRGVVVAKCEGLSEYDVRRPVTASGTSLLGLVKHLIGIEQVYLGTSFGRPTPFTLPWVEDGSIWDGADMWATEDEPREWLLDLYAQACAHSDETVAALDLDSPGSVPHWDEERPRDHARRPAGRAWSTRPRTTPGTPTSAGRSSTARASPTATRSATRAYWSSYVARIQAAADAFRA